MLLAINEGIQLFLAGSAGLLQTTEDVRFEPCPGLTAAGRGVLATDFKSVASASSATSA